MEGLFELFEALDICKSDTSQIQDKIDLLSKVSRFMHAINKFLCFIVNDISLSQAISRSYSSLNYESYSLFFSRCVADGVFRGVIESWLRASRRLCTVVFAGGAGQRILVHSRFCY